ncbi:MAG: FtsQ-type POTRA domain-containing protein [Thermoleophilaceae bacterium]|nr:FtsQ-type POTRA domain-containing protein [Thermoleophilaceae bacterium]
MSSQAQATDRTFPRGAGALPRAALRLPRRARRWALLAVVVGAALAPLYFAWLRDSSLVRVEHVTVTGLTTSEAARVRSALVEEARGMTTLHVRPERLAAAVAGFPVVRAIRVRADFPHGLAIHVSERRPAALLRGPGGAGAIVAGDGTVLPGVEAQALPVVRLSGSLPVRRLTPASSPGRAVAVAAAAPAALAPRIESVGEERGEGLVARLENGPRIVFGGADRLAAKWAAAAAVLADDSSRGAAYIDVTLPERPVAGGVTSM